MVNFINIYPSLWYGDLYLIGNRDYYVVLVGIGHCHYCAVCLLSTTLELSIPISTLIVVILKIPGGKYSVLQTSTFGQIDLRLPRESVEAENGWVLDTVPSLFPAAEERWWTLGTTCAGYYRAYGLMHSYGKVNLYHDVRSTLSIC